MYWALIYARFSVSTYVLLLKPLTNKPWAARFATDKMRIKNYEILAFVIHNFDQ